MIDYYFANVIHSSIFFSLLIACAQYAFFHGSYADCIENECHVVWHSKFSPRYSFMVAQPLLLVTFLTEINYFLEIFLVEDGKKYAFCGEFFWLRKKNMLFLKIYLTEWPVTFVTWNLDLPLLVNYKNFHTYSDTEFM